MWIPILIVALRIGSGAVDAFIIPKPWSPAIEHRRPKSIFTQKVALRFPVVKGNVTLDRFDRIAPVVSQIDDPCILTIDGTMINVTSWAKAHPGGAAILKKFHGKDATKTFHAVGHSAAAEAMLQDFAVGNKNTQSASTPVARKPRWRSKLFTKEDPIGVHKYLGVFVLLHFAFRFYQMLLGDPSGGLGSRMGKGPSWIPLICLAPHALLSLSSLIFHTVPKDRVVGKPMIWQEYRVHNISFGLRSVITAALCALSIRYKTTRMRKIAVWGSALTCLLALRVADLGTRYLRTNNVESTTATMPYWEGCSLSTQKRFKSFYAYSQFLATLACLSVSNPAWPLSVLLAIQLASLLMTLVRKGFLTTRGYHYGYTAALIAPYLVALRSARYVRRYWEVPSLFLLGAVLYRLRRRGVNKYALWIPVIVARVLYGDEFITWEIW